MLQKRFSLFSKIKFHFKRNQLSLPDCLYMEQGSLWDYLR